MPFRDVLALRGPNIWANSPVLEAWVELGELKDTSSAMVPGFVDRLMVWLTSLIEHGCSEGHRGGSLVRLREGTYPAHILEHVALELQCLAGTPVGYGRARETSEPGVYRVVVEYREETPGRACLEAGRRLLGPPLSSSRPEDATEARIRYIGPERLANQKMRHATRSQPADRSAAIRSKMPLPGAPRSLEAIATAASSPGGRGRPRSGRGHRGGDSGMEFRTIRALRGPNIWSEAPVLVAQVVLQELRDATPGSIPGFATRLLAWLPGLDRPGLELAESLARSALELQRLAGVSVDFAGTRRGSSIGVWELGVEYAEESLGRAALDSAHRLVLAAIYDRPFDLEVEVARLRDLAHDECLGPSTRSIVRAALTRGIPFRRLNEGSLVQLGQGARQRRILTAETDGTGAIAEAIAQDKELTRRLLQDVGVPVPRGRAVTDADDAWRAALEVGVPVVIKPRDGNQGRGVATNLTSREQVVAAYRNAHVEGEGVLVEQFARGYDHRILVIGERVVAAARREPAHVIGDGRSTVAQLVCEVNRDPRRSDGHSTALSFIRLDAISLDVLAEQGQGPDSVPEAGRRVLIRRNANLSTGGTATDVTDQVHPAVAACAVDAARVIGLDIAGIDLVIEDIARPMEDQGGMIVEVNAGPGLRMHLEPSEGKGRPVGEAIVATLFADGQSGRVPTVGLAGSGGGATIGRLVARILAGSGYTVGSNGPEGVVVGGRRVAGAVSRGPAGVRALMVNPRVEAAVLAFEPEAIRAEGLGIDRLDVALVSRIDATGPHDPNLDATALAVLVRAGRVAVLQADDPSVAGLAPVARGRVVLFALDADHPALAAHRDLGGWAAFARDGQIVLAEGEDERTLIGIDRVPATRDGRAGLQVENALAVAATAWALDLADAAIRSALETFDVPDEDAEVGAEVAAVMPGAEANDAEVDTGPGFFADPDQDEESSVVLRI